MSSSYKYRYQKYDSKMSSLTRQTGGASDIRVKLDDGTWIQAREYQAEAFSRFSDPTNAERPIVYDQVLPRWGRVRFTIQREVDQRIYLIRENGTRMPIVDWNNVQVFLLDLPGQPVNWYDARDYQTWAYFDFIYSGDDERNYMSAGSRNIVPHIRYITIPNPALPADIVFRMSRNDNGTVFYEKNDAGRTRVRISDNARERSAYLGFYRRMTDFGDILHPVTRPAAAAVAAAVAAPAGPLAIPVGAIIAETLDDEEMCIVCNTNKQNIRFLPCKHTNTCSECCREMLGRATPYLPFSCPMCRGRVSQIVLYTPGEAVATAIVAPTLLPSTEEQLIAKMQREYTNPFRWGPYSPNDDELKKREEYERARDSLLERRPDLRRYAPFGSRFGQREFSPSTATPSVMREPTFERLLPTATAIGDDLDAFAAASRRGSPAAASSTAAPPSRVAPAAAAAATTPSRFGHAPSAATVSESALQQLLAMGFDRRVSTSALLATNNDVQRSINILLSESGIESEHVPMAADGGPRRDAPMAAAVRPPGFHPHSTDWFECAFGFKEQSYAYAKAKFERMVIEGGNTHLNGIQIGRFELLSGQQLHTALPSAPIPGRVTIENIGNTDIRAVHQNPALSANATIQVASQFNCLEMIQPSTVPDEGITMYINDRTQGPICAMAAPAGLVYRNYLHNGGQTSGNQVDMVADLLRYLRTFDPTITWRMQNGYLMFDNAEDLKKINRVLASDPTIRRQARSIIQSGSHSDQGVFVQCVEYAHNVNHVYCSGLPISPTYNRTTPEVLWDGFAEIVLEAMYENTLLIACMNNARTGQNRPCYLTQVGGGVFGMKHTQIIRAIQRACNVVARKGLSLDVKVVHYGAVNSAYNLLPTVYPVAVVTAAVGSVWDDDAWVGQSL